jgi:hypothetical protein
MSEEFDRQVRRLLHDTALVIGADDAHGLLPGTGPAASAPVRPKQERLMRLRPLAVAAVVLAVLAVTIGVIRSVRPTTSPADVSASASAPAALNCPPQVPAGKVSPPAKQTDMVTAAPTDGLLCVYGPLPEHKFTGSTRIPATALGELRTMLNALPAMPAWPPSSCPFDDGSAYLIALRTPSGDQHIWMRRTGCSELTDGHQIRRASPQLVDLVKALA